jgi:hypothetical protein
MEDVALRVRNLAKRLKSHKGHLRLRKPEESLDKAARDFIRVTTRNRLVRRSNILYLSAIYKWYGADFITEAGAVFVYVKK